MCVFFLNSRLLFSDFRVTPFVAIAHSCEAAVFFLSFIPLVISTACLPLILLSPFYSFSSPFHCYKHILFRCFHKSPNATSSLIIDQLLSTEPPPTPDSAISPVRKLPRIPAKGTEQEEIEKQIAIEKRIEKQKLQNRFLDGSVRTNISDYKAARETFMRKFGKRSFLKDAQKRLPPMLYTFPGSGNTWCRLLIEYGTGIYSGNKQNVLTDERIERIKIFYDRERTFSNDKFQELILEIFFYFVQCQCTTTNLWCTPCLAN